MLEARSDNPTRRRAFSIALCVPLLLVLVLSEPSPAAPGALDVTFSGDGKLTTLMGPSGIGYAAGARSVAIQADGKIVVAGQVGGGNNERFGLARYDANGSLDPAFSGDGKVTTGFGSPFAGATSVAIQTDGNIVAAGWTVSGNNTRFALARYDTNGVLDPTFDGDGKLITPIGSSSGATAVAIQTDGKIVAAGDGRFGNTTRFALARYDSSGILDPGFSGNGKLSTQIGSFAQVRSVAIQLDGMIVVAGESAGTNNSKFALARYQTGGVLDPSFGGNGTVVTTFGSPSLAGAASVAIQPDGKVVAAGYRGGGSGDKFALARYDATGILDNTFGSNANGKVVTSMGAYAGAQSVGIQPDGMIVSAGAAAQGNTSVFALARYQTTGVLDPAFGNGGKVKTLIGSGAWGSSVAIQPSDGQLVVAGQASTGNHYRFALARYDD